jgi:muramidase (phage lysozyme)
MHGLLSSALRRLPSPFVPASIALGCSLSLLLPQAPARAAVDQLEAPPTDSAPALASPLELAPRPTRVALRDAAQPAETAAASSTFPITPERRALLNTIRFAEGTWARGEDLGYRIMFGGGLAPHLERHPDRVNYSGGYASAAAGAYQFMPFTWALASRSLRLQGFGPHVQDQAALFLIQRRGALELADRGEFTPHLAAKLAPEWASFPTLAGRSYYGQPVQRYALLKSFYERNLSELRAGAAVPASVAQAPTCLPVDSLRCKLEALEAMGPRSKPLGI